MRRAEPAERDAPALAARKGRHVPFAVGQTKRIHRPVERRVEAPRVRAVDLLLHGRLLGEQRVEVGVGLGELRRDRVEAVEEVAKRAHAVLDVLAHVPGRVELRFLGEHADGRAGGELGDPARRLVEPRHDPQQRRLAGAVRAEHADLRAGQERERDVREHLAVRAVKLVGPVHREDVVAHGEITIAAAPALCSACERVLRTPRARGVLRREDGRP